MGKKSKSTSTSKTIYNNTTTTNPYVTSRTDNSGTASNFNKGTAFDTINDFVNSNISNLLDEYLNPSLNSTTNKAKMNAFSNTLANQSAKSLENDIINPLSQRNMVRSSQATNMYNNLLQNNVNQIGDYANQLLSTSQKETATLLNNLLTYYLSGYDVLSDNQKQSLQTSAGNATRTNTNTGENGFNYTSTISNLASRLALSALGL